MYIYWYFDGANINSTSYNELKKKTEMYKYLRLNKLLEVN